MQLRATGRTLLAAAALVACGRQSPREISFGNESCGHCHMTIADPRFGAEAISPTGKVTAFDDVGCLAAWLDESGARNTSGWVMSFVDGRGWLAAEQSVYLQSEALRTPMGSGLAALRAGAEADSVHAAFGGTLLTWDQVRSSPHQHRSTPPS
jgi:copper chaperone NosL